MLLEHTRYGLYCRQADIFIDPTYAVPKAILTHAHSDHARRGSKQYLAHTDSAPLLKIRLGEINLQTLDYHQPITINDVKISLHPAGHMIGSSQVRIEYQGEVWVVSGDYKLQSDGITSEFEPVKCNTFITEATFGLPIFHWPKISDVAAEINSWWLANQHRQVRSVLLGYSLGKAQRLTAMVDQSLGQIFLHPKIFEVNAALRQNGANLPFIPELTSAVNPEKTALIIAPPGVLNSDWGYQITPYSAAYASGWMQLARMRKMQGMDRGFIVSDHVDWQSLEAAVDATGAEHVIVTHGYEEPYANWLRSKGKSAQSYKSFAHV